MQSFIILILLISLPAVFSRVLLRQDKSDTIDDIIKASENFAQNATDFLSYPIIFTAEKLNYLANLLPSVFAAQGALTGSAIALPIQLSTSLVAGTAAGINGFIVSIPIAIGSSINAARGKDLFIRIKPKTHFAFPESNTTMNNTNISSDNNDNDTSIISKENDLSTTVPTTTLADNDDYNDEESNSLIKTLLLKPIAIIVGTKSALSGAGYYIIGKGFEKIGGTLSSIGHSLIFNGNEVRGTGATMFKFATGHEIPLLSANDDLMSAVNITKALPEPLKEFVFDAISSRKIKDNND